MSDRSGAESSGSVPVEWYRGERRVDGRRNMAVSVTQRFLGFDVVCLTMSTAACFDVGEVRGVRTSTGTQAGRATSKTDME